MKLSANEMLFMNSAEAAREKAKRIIANGGTAEALARNLRTAGDFYREAAELVLKRARETRS